MRPIVDQSIIRPAGVPRLAIGANPGFVFDHDFPHGRVWLHARFHRQIKIFAGKKSLQLDRFLSRNGAVHGPNSGLHVFHRGIYERIRVFLARSSRFLLWLGETMRRIRKHKECRDRPDPTCASRYDLFHIGSIRRPDCPRPIHRRKMDCVNMERPIPSSFLLRSDLLVRLRTRSRRQIFHPAKHQLFFRTRENLRHDSIASKQAANPRGPIAGPFSDCHTKKFERAVSIAALVTFIL